MAQSTNKLSLNDRVQTGKMSARTRLLAEDAIQGRSHGLKALFPFLGPAFIAAVGYVDPGNFATNIQGGALFGYNLLWVIVFANLMAMLMQTLSSKLGIATGRNLAEMCGERMSKPLAYFSWIIAEFGAMATDLAEFLGASLGLNLLLGIPLIWAALITGVITYFILMLERKGFRPLEATIAGMILIIAACYVVETLLTHPSGSQVALHAVEPWLGSDGAVLIAVGIIGATVMPHAVFLHSGLTQNRIVPKNAHEAKRIHKGEKVDAIIAMSLAGLVNMAILLMAAVVFHATGHESVAQLPTAYRTLTPLLGGFAAAVFLTSLMASGISSSAVGTLAGQMIMQGFVGFTIPTWMRRVVTMVPAVVVILIGLDPTLTLVVSQAILSIVLPLPLITLTLFTSDRSVMGELVNSFIVTATAWVLTGVIVGLNVLLILQTAGVGIPL